MPFGCCWSRNLKAKTLKLPVWEVYDAGRTEVAAMSRTVIGIGPVPDVLLPVSTLLVAAAGGGGGSISG